MRLLVLVLLAFFSQSLFSQTLSVYGGGGATSYSEIGNVTGRSFKNYVSPNLLLGMRYDFGNAMRISVNCDFGYLKSIDRSIVSKSDENNNFQIQNRNGVLFSDSLQIQNKNLNQNIGFDLSYGYNVVSTPIFRIATETGFGILMGENKKIETWAVNQNCVAQGEAFMNIYTHSWITSSDKIDKFTNIYIPVSVTAEYDITKMLSVGLYCRYKYLPYKDYSPNNLISFGGFVKFTLNRLPHLK